LAARFVFGYVLKGGCGHAFQYTASDPARTLVFEPN
jgi:hypothetical protein